MTFKQLIKAPFYLAAMFLLYICFGLTRDEED